MLLRIVLALLSTRDDFKRRIGASILQNGRVASLLTPGDLVVRFREIMFTSLYNNAFYLMLNSASTAILGFIFWKVMADAFSPSIVGIGSALLSAAGLVSNMASLGLGNGLMRFVPEAGNRASKFVNGVFLVSSIIALLVSLVYIAGTSVWSPSLHFLAQRYLLGFCFMAVTALITVSNLCDYSFIAQRLARYTFLKNLIVSLAKIPLPILVFSALGGYGIFLGCGVAVVMAVIVSFVLFLPRAYPRSAFDGGVDFYLAYRALPFSLGNYLASLFNQAIGSVLPLIVLNIKGAESNAYFYMAWMMASVIAIIPNGVATSLFAECSHYPDKLNHYLKRSLLVSLALLVPAVGVLWVLAPWLLGFFGQAYAANGTETLRWLLLSNFPQAINSFYRDVNRVKKRMSYIVYQAFAMSSLTLGLGYLLLQEKGLAGIGIGYTLANLTVALVVAVPLWRTMRKDPQDEENVSFRV